MVYPALPIRGTEVVMTEDGPAEARIGQSSRFDTGVDE